MAMPFVGNAMIMGTTAPCMADESVAGFVALRQLTFGGNAQDEAAVDVKARNVRPEYLGISNCQICHSNGLPRGVVLPGSVEIAYVEDQWILAKEVPIWSLMDKHAQAYSVLFSERSKTIGERMQVKDGAVHRDARCLACHTGYPMDGVAVDNDGLVDESFHQRADVTLGVSCEGCHGPSGTNKDCEGWFHRHSVQPTLPPNADAWRFLSPLAKEKFGFKDVRSPSSRTRICVSCHVGSVDEGRILTHEMYAAGHPPLPGFEIQAYVGQMPRHWRRFPEKPKDVRETFVDMTCDPLYKQDAGGNQQVDQFDDVRSLLVGALVTYSEYLKLTADLADAAVTSTLSNVSKPEWPELAQFECFACHHELRYPGWRQSRHVAGVPGRPFLREWPLAVAKLALQEAGKGATVIEGRLRKITDALDAQPYGSRTESIAAARGAAALADDTAAQLEKETFTRTRAVGVVRAVVKACTTESMDYDSARQLVWTLIALDQELRGKQTGITDILAELESRSNPVNSSPIILSGERFGDLLGSYDADDRFGTIFRSLQSETLSLDLRAGRAGRRRLADDMPERNTVEVELRKVLPYVGRFDPEAIHSKARQLEPLVDRYLAK